MRPIEKWGEIYNQMIVDKEESKRSTLDFQAKMFSESSIYESPDSDKKEENTDDAKEQEKSVISIIENKE